VIMMDGIRIIFCDAGCFPFGAFCASGAMPDAHSMIRGTA